MICSVGDVSGGHFNPAVTAAIQLSGKSDMDLKEVAAYVGVQTGAAILAGFTYAGAHAGATFPLGPGVGRGWAGVCIVETVFTFVLAMVVLCMACQDTKPPKNSQMI